MTPTVRRCVTPGCRRITLRCLCERHRGEGQALRSPLNGNRPPPHAQNFFPFQQISSKSNQQMRLIGIPPGGRTE